MLSLNYDFLIEKSMKKEYTTKVQFFDEGGTSMELTDIKDLIQRDEEARKSVENAHQRKYDLKQKIADKKKSIGDYEWEEVRKQVELIKAELDQRIQDEAENNRTEFYDVSNRIQSVFEKNKDKWCDEIVKRCLE